MKLYDAISIASFILTGASFILAIFAVRRDQRRRRLVFAHAAPLEIASVLPDESGHRIQILYERAGGTPVSIKGAYLNFVQLSNLGQEPVRDTDLIADDPLRLEIEGATVLDASIASEKRDVCGFRLGDVEEHDTGSVTIPVAFKLLDIDDSVLIRVITDTGNARIGLRGSIVGYPSGIQAIDLESESQARGCTGFAIWLVAVVLSFVGSFFLVYDLVDIRSRYFMVLTFFVPGIVAGIVLLIMGWVVRPLVRTGRHGQMLPLWYRNRSRSTQIGDI